MHKMVRLPAYYKAVSKNGRRSARRHFRSEERAAFLRAETGVGLYRKGGITLQQAADRSGSCVAYLSSALILDEAVRNGWVLEAWVSQIRRGEVAVRQGADLLKPAVKLLRAFKNATPMALRIFFRVTGYTDDLSVLLANSAPEQRTKAAKAIGMEAVWSDMIEPLTKSLKAAE
jgi:hypothetical protein